MTDSMLSRGMVNLEGKKVKNIDDFWVYVYVPRTTIFKDVHRRLSDGFCEGRYELYTSLDFFCNIWTYSSSNTFLEAYFDYLSHREKNLTKNFF